MKFLQNKYTIWYYNIISRAKSRDKNTNTNVYFEKHHIVPQSLGGNNSKDNIATLTGREHFICHILLTKMTSGVQNYKMIHAAIGMKRARNYQARYINSRLYEHIKKEFAVISRQRNKGKILSDETRAKMSSAAKGKPKTEETRAKMSTAAKGKSKGPMSNEEKLKRSLALKGRPSHKKGKKAGPQHTLESKAKIAESNRRRVYSDETRAKISAGVKAANLKRQFVSTTFLI